MSALALNRAVNGQGLQNELCPDVSLFLETACRSSTLFAEAQLLTADEEPLVRMEDKGHCGV